MSEADAAATPGIERDAVTDWLREHIDGAAPPFTFSLVAAGGSNLTYRVVDGSGAQPRTADVGTASSAHATMRNDKTACVASSAAMAASA